MGNGSAELLRRNNSAIEFEQFPRTDAVRFRFHYTELKVTNLNLSPDSALKRLGFRLAVIYTVPKLGIILSGAPANSVSV